MIFPGIKIETLLIDLNRIVNHDQCGYDVDKHMWYHFMSGMVLYEFNVHKYRMSKPRVILQTWTGLSSEETKLLLLKQMEIEDEKFKHCRRSYGGNKIYDTGHAPKVIRKD